MEVGSPLDELSLLAVTLVIVSEDLSGVGLFGLF